MIAHGDVQRALEEAGQICGRMCQAVLLVASLGERDEDAFVEVARGHSHCGACEFCIDMIIALRMEASFGTVNVVGRYRWVVRCLLGNVGDSDWGGIVMRSHRIWRRLRRRLFRSLYCGSICVDLPVALRRKRQPVKS